MAVGDPTGADLCVGTTDGDTLLEYGDEPGWTEREITFVTPIELTEGVKYAIVVNAASRTGEAELAWSTRVDNPYANGDRYGSSDSGGSWSLDEDDDVWFKTKAETSAWADATEYAVGALVTYNGDIYICIVAHTSDAGGPPYEAPDTNVTDWVADDAVKDNGSFEEDAFDRWESMYGVNWSVQTFTAGSTYTISSVVLKLAKYTTWGGTVETVTVSIRATDDGKPGAPTIVSPTPTGVTDITLDETPLEWAAGDPAGDTYEIYFRESGDAWGDPVGEAQAGVTWAIVFGALAYGTTYQWRIDATNEYGTTEGATWSFDTIDYDQLRISYRLISGGNGNGPYDFDADGNPTGTEGTDWAWTGENNMITVRRLVVAANNKIWYESI